MDTAGDRDTKELQLFRERWREQLTKEIADVGLPSGNDRREGSGGLHVRQFRNDQHGIKQHLLVNSGNDKEPKTEDSVLNQNENELILMSFPEPDTRDPCKNICKQQKLQSKIGDCVKTNEKSLVDQLIEDIDDITSIPFFDLSLPKEVGIQIFTHLCLKDLCMSAQVSKSWKVLAEDELLWHDLGCKLGYVQKGEQTVIDRANWKEFVRNRVLEERDLRRNWKERICKLSSLEFERGGTLCVVSVHGNLICSGYSSGAVVVWEVDSETNTSYRELTTAFDIQEQKPQVTSTAVNGTLCAAGYFSGTYMMVFE